MKVHSIKTARYITVTMVMLYPSGDSDRGRRIRSFEDTWTYLHCDVGYGASAQARAIQNGFILSRIGMAYQQKKMVSSPPDAIDT